MWLIPVLCVVAFGVIFAAGARRSSTEGEVDREAHSMVRSERVSDLREQLRRAPMAVLETRRHRKFGTCNRLVLDMGGREIDAWCFWAPTQPISIVHGLRFCNEVGWVIDIEGPRGPGRLCAWRIDVR